MRPLLYSLANLLPLALLLLLLPSNTTAAPVAIITAGPSFTQDTWGDIKQGTWLIELYSPYCHHCVAFAPTWRDLVDAKGPSSAATNFRFGQVDCAANGDLCAAEGVKYYPSLFLYVNGTIFDQYEGARKLDPLIKYVEANTPGDVEWAPEEATADGSSTVGTGTTVRDEESVTSDERVLGSEGQVLRVVEAPDSPSLPPFTPPPTVPGSLRKQVNLEEKKRRTSSKGVSPDGTVHVLEGTAVHGIKAEGNAPAFVKYYAPWCGHCKTLAPLWKVLAKELEGQVHVYEMDCDAAANKKACKIERVTGYPTLLFYADGNRITYKGPRDVESMKAFALKASAASQHLTISDAAELTAAGVADDIFFLFLHPTDLSTEDKTLMQQASKVLIGTTSFYTSTNPTFFTQFALAPSPYLLVFKHSSVPTLKFPLPRTTLSKKTRLELTTEWIGTAKLPFLSELSSTNYADLMQGTSKNTPLVALAILSPTLLHSIESTKGRLEELAKGWHARRSEQFGSRDVLWAWVDGDRWGGWAKGMYQVQEGKSPVVLVVGDPKNLDYWKNSLAGKPLSIEGDEIYELVEGGIYTGKAKALSSRSFLERLGTSIANSGSTIATEAIDHPILSFLLLGVVAFVVYTAGQWLAAPMGSRSPRTATYAKLE